VEIADLFCDAVPTPRFKAICELSDNCRVALHIGHVPGAPGLVYELTDRARSPRPVAAIGRRFPAAAVAQLEFDGDWSSIGTCCSGSACLLPLVLNQPGRARLDRQQVRS
jgi:phosphohistidine phosphatase SixA